jgi:nucleoside-diphosphate-sugar epimerase
MTTVFVTGGSGFIGQAVIHQLLKCLRSEDRLFMLVRKPVESADRRVVPVLGDLESIEKVDDLVRKANYIIHIAGEARLCGGGDVCGINVASTKQLVEMAKEGGSLQRFIFISSIAAMDRAPSDRCNEPITVASPCFPRTDYGISKRKAEEIILRSNLPYTIFRPGFVYGPGMRNDSHLRKFARFIRKGIPLHMLGFPGKISLIHVDDLAVAIAKCLTSDLGVNRTYLAETEFMPLGDALSLLGESLYGHPSARVAVPAFKSVFQRVHSKLPGIVAGLFLDYFWMNDPDFRNEFIDDSQQRSFRDNVHDIIRDFLVKSG